MELRSTNHLHFIKTAKGGSVTRVLNISHGRPALVYKCVKDIYENAKMLSSYPVLKPKEEVDFLTVDSNDATVQKHWQPVVQRRTIKVTESSGLDCSSGDERKDSDLEDMGFGNITLKQIKERCKGNKRKRATNSKLTEETAETGSELKQDCSNLQEYDPDLTVPLSCWKSKTSKKKARRKSTKNCSLTLTKGIESIVKVEEFYDYEGYLHHEGAIPAPTDVEVAVPTSGYSDDQGTVRADVDSSLGCTGSFEVEIPELDCMDVQSLISAAGNSSIGCNEIVDCSVAEVPESDSSIAEIKIHDAEDSSVGCNEDVGCSVVEISDSDYSDAQIITHVAGDSSVGYNENAGWSFVEVPESDPSDDQIVIHVSSDSPFGCNQTAASSEVEVTKSNCSDGNNIVCIAPDTDPSHMENIFCVAGECYEEMVSDVLIPSTVIKAANDCILEADPPLSFSTESQCHMCMDPANSKLLPPERVTGKETTWEHNTESINGKCLELLVLEGKSEGDIAFQIPNSPSTVTILQTNGCSEVIDASQNYPSMTKVPRQTNNEPRIEMPDLAICNSLTKLELSDGGDQCNFEKDTEDGLPSNVEANATRIPLGNYSLSFDSDPCSRSDSSASIGHELLMAEETQSTRLHGCLASIDDTLHTAKEKQPLLLTGADPSRDSLPFDPSPVTDDLEGLPGDRNYECAQLQHTPKRLFSARKYISPTSRKRLCKALEADGCCHNHKCDGELCSVKQPANEICRVEDPNQIRGTENAISTSQKTKKQKDNEKGSPPKRKLKVSLHSRAIPSLSSGCDSIQICSENAIAFSQQQMRDIERIATRLTEELKAMKDIVEERLCSQSSPTKSPKHDVDEVRTAITNANKAEETTQRWLTMMTKDCKRFCKIMSLTEKGPVAPRNAFHSPSLTEKPSAAASANGVNKERKKITFADEAGGQLCHVKIFDGEMAYLEEASCHDEPEFVAT